MVVGFPEPVTHRGFQPQRSRTTSARQGGPPEFSRRPASGGASHSAVQSFRSQRAKRSRRARPSLYLLRSVLVLMPATLPLLVYCQKSQSPKPFGTDGLSTS